MDIKITVITVCLNSAATIEQSLASVAAQAYENIEHIVIDGNSTDKTTDIVRTFKHSVTRLVSEPDSGIYDAMNKGIVISSGEVIAFLNADDYYADRDVLASVAEQFESRRLDLVYGDVAFVRPDDVNRVVRVYSSRKFKPSLIPWGWMPAHPAMFVAKSVFDRCGSFNNHYQIAGDYEFVARIFSRLKLNYSYLPRTLVKMRTGGISTRNWKSTILLNKEVLRACRDNGIRSNYFKILSKYPIKAIEIVRPFHR